MNIYEQILAKLRTKFTGADDATLQRIASKKSEGVTDEAKVDSIVEGISFADVMNNYGDYRADGAQKTAVANYEKKHNIKDGKPIEAPRPAPAPEPTPKPEPTPAPTPSPAPAPAPEPAQPQAPSMQDIAKMVAAGVAEAMKPFGERLDRMDAEKAQQEFDAKVESVAKSFNIPTFAYKGKVIPKDVDLNQYFTDLKQEMQNEGYQFAPAPQTSTQPDPTKEGEQVASLIKEGTEQLTKESK
jgi:hypothetical protein